MASIPYAEFLGSTQFKFVVGQEAKEYTMHSALVARQSEPLNAMVNGKFREGEEKYAVWKEVEVDTFIRFSQYAYTGDYEGAEPRKIFERSPLLNNADISVDWDISYERERKSKKEQLWETFCQLYPRTQPSLARNVAEDDYTEVLLSHARMYVFADYHGIEDLQHAALQKLKEVLSRYTIFEQGPREIAQLIKYSFDHTVDEDKNRDPLRTLVSTYTACQIEELLGNADFEDLFDRVSGFPISLMTKLRDRLA